MSWRTFVPHREQTLVEKDSPSLRVTKSSFSVGQPTLVTFLPSLQVQQTHFPSLSIHSRNCLKRVLKQQPHILQFIRSAWLFQLSSSSRSRHGLCCCTATSTHFWSSSISTTFHYMQYISQRSNPKNCFRITGLQCQDSKQRNRSPSVSNSQMQRSCERIFDSSTIFFNLLVRTNSVYGKQTVGFLSLTSHALQAYEACTVHTHKTLSPRFPDFFTNFVKKPTVL